MIWVLDQSRSAAYNLCAIEILSVVDNHLVIDEGSTKRVVARYTSDEEAQEVFEDMLHDLETINAVPFADSDFTTYVLPKADREKGGRGKRC